MNHSVTDKSLCTVCTWEYLDISFHFSFFLLARNGGFWTFCLGFKIWPYENLPRIFPRLPKKIIFVEKWVEVGFLTKFSANFVPHVNVQKWWTKKWTYTLIVKLYWFNNLSYFHITFFKIIILWPWLHKK